MLVLEHRRKFVRYAFSRKYEEVHQRLVAYETSYDRNVRATFECYSDVDLFILDHDGGTIRYSWRTD